MSSVLSVKQLNLYVRSLIESDEKLSFISVTGEISNYKNHYSSGHKYFTLKDSDAAIRCVMFKSNALKLKTELFDGLSVICKGRISLYEKDGTYQFYVEEILPIGEGALAIEFEKIKERLNKQGLFDIAHKKPIPSFPKTVAVVTSDTGAALQDILNVISRRYPICEIVLCPVLVQGAGAAETIIDALQRLYKLNCADVIILGRGGGSAEDLWAFNDEKLAHTIFNSPIPVISAVGHEVDFTICDFVADLRAPTPSAAAELAVPDISEMKSYLDNISFIIKSQITKTLKNAELKLENLKNSRFIKSPYTIVEEKSLYFDKLIEKFNNASYNFISKTENRFKLNVAKLEALSPLKVLTRGFSVMKIENKIVKSVKDAEINKNAQILLSDGEISCKITEIKE